MSSIKKKKSKYNHIKSDAGVNSILAYGLPKETIAAVMMLYENTKVKVRSPNEDTDLFAIIAGVQPRDILDPYLFIICLDYVLRTSIVLMEENGFTL